MGIGNWESRGYHLPVPGKVTWYPRIIYLASVNRPADRRMTKLQFTAYSNTATAMQLREKRRMNQGVINSWNEQPFIEQVTSYHGTKVPSNKVHGTYYVLRTQYPVRVA